MLINSKKNLPVNLAASLLNIENLCQLSCLLAFGKAIVEYQENVALNVSQPKMEILFKTKIIVNLNKTIHKSYQGFIKCWLTKWTPTSTA